MGRWKTILAAILVAVLATAAIVVFFGKDGPEPQETSKSTRKADLSRRNGRVQREIRIQEKGRGGEKGYAVVKSKKAVRQKPVFDIDDDDEALLNEEQRKTIAAIRAALDGDDRAQVLKLVQKLQASDEWPDGIPKSIKMAAIQALGWFGASCLPEIAGFLGDPDPEVIQAAIEKYEEALFDMDLSDHERSLILIEASKIINDADAMDSMLFGLNDMRHSRAVETIKALMVVGSEATKQVLPEAVEFYTGEEGLDTFEKLDEWLKENPDDEDDDEFYGGSKD